MYNHSPVLQYLSFYAENTPDKKAIIIAGGKEVSYYDLLLNAKKAATILINMGVTAGQRIILSGHKDVEFIYIYLGAHILGVINVIVDAESNESRLRYIEERIKPACCFGYVSPDYVCKKYSEINFEAVTPYTESSAEISVDDVAEILFTTGTSGTPKGVCLSYANIYASAENINQFIQNSNNDVEILGLPICHSFGLGRIRCNILKGSSIVIINNFANVRQFFNVIEQYKVTGFGLVPAVWAYIRKISGKRISKFAGQIRYIEIGSAAMSIEAKKEILEFFPNTRICMHYGLTEASRVCFLEFHDLLHLDTIGKPVCNKVDVKIIDSNGEQVTCGIIGEICVKGNMVMLHYLDSKDNENAFWNDYFRTGDCGFIDSDGYVHLLGREKELINVGGKKVSPMEVEDAICSLGVGDCICVPMMDPVGILGEVVKCYVLKGSTELSFEQIAEMLRVKLEYFKLPVYYDWIDKIPKTTSGKKQRINLK